VLNNGGDELIAGAVFRLAEAYREKALAELVHSIRHRLVSQLIAWIGYPKSILLRAVSKAPLNPALIIAESLARHKHGKRQPFNVEQAQGTLDRTGLGERNCIIQAVVGMITINPERL
jgi:hypothetical protein